MSTTIAELETCIGGKVWFLCHLKRGFSTHLCPLVTPKTSSEPKVASISSSPFLSLNPRIKLFCPHTSVLQIVDLESFLVTFFCLLEHLQGSDCNSQRSAFICSNLSSHHPQSNYQEPMSKIISCLQHLSLPTSL